jgi:hypothetical protein
MSELIAPPYAPPAAGPYSPGLLTGDWIYLSGQGGFDPDAGEHRRSARSRFCCARPARRSATSSPALCISAIWHSSPSSMPAARSSSRAR